MLDDDALRYMLGLKADGYTNQEIADQLGIGFETLRKRLKIAARRGLMGFRPTLPGFETSKITTDGDGNPVSIVQKPEHGEDFAIPPTHLLGKITYNVAADGRVIQTWPRVHPSVSQALELIKHVKLEFAEFEGRAQPIPAPLHTEADFLNLIPCNDWHVNLLTWKNQVGINWDLKIAERIIGDAIEASIRRARRAAVAVVLGGGDLMHNDDNTNRTAKSGNVLDADGRHPKGARVAERLMVRAIDAALECNDTVEVRILEGNHDETTSHIIAHFLFAWYRNEPRVTVSLDDSPFWYRQFGLVMLAATHGHMVKLSAMPMIMAHRQPEMWGATRHRYAHGFHVHHKEKLATEGQGVICESHQAPIPADGWHHASGYLSGRSVKTMTYHRLLGFYTEEREPIMDAADFEPRTARAA